MRSRKQSLWVKLVATLLALLAICISLWGIFLYPYRSFRAQEIETLPSYDALNDAVLKELPEPPEGVELKSKGSGGIVGPSNMHGRILRLTFSIVNTRPYDIYTYYENALATKGWANVYRGEIIYYRNTSCIKIKVYDSQFLKEYYISIWQDFSAQDFSPALPPLWLLRFYDFGETDILTCPPE